MKPYCFITLFHLLLVGVCFSQGRNDFQARVVLKDGKTINGIIHVKPSRLTPQRFEVIDAENKASAPVILTADNTRSININDSIYYVANSIRLYTNLTATDIISTDTAQPVKDGNFFLERVVKGDKVSLYTFIDEDKSHFIIQDSSGSFKSLQYARYIDNMNGVSNVRDLSYYKSQLLYFAGDRSDVQKVILSSKFELDDLLHAVVAINNNNEIGKKTNELTKKKKLIYVYGEMTVIMSQIKYAGIPASMSAMNFSTQFFPKIGIGGEMHLGHKEKVLLSLSTSFYPFKITGKEEEKNSTGETVHKSFNAAGFYVAFNSLFEYVVLRSKQSQLAVGTGYSFMLSHYGKNEYLSDDKNANGSTVVLDQLDFSNFWSQYSFIVEYFMNQKMSIYGSYAPRHDFAGFIYSTFTQSHLSLGVKYRF